MTGNGRYPTLAQLRVRGDQIELYINDDDEVVVPMYSSGGPAAGESICVLRLPPVLARVLAATLNQACDASEGGDG
jgi:hypothetical protein